MESNRSAGSHITPTSSGSSRGDLGESEIVREFTSSLGRAIAASPMDVITAAELTDKNLSNHIALSRHFDHLRHEQPTVGTPVLAVDPRTATAGEAPLPVVAIQAHLNQAPVHETKGQKSRPNWRA